MPSPMFTKIPEQDPVTEKIHDTKKKLVEPATSDVTSSVESVETEDSDTVSVKSDTDYDDVFNPVPDCKVYKDDIEEKPVQKPISSNEDVSRPLIPGETRIAISPNEENLMPMNTGWDGDGFLGKWLQFSETVTAPTKIGMFILLALLAFSIGLSYIAYKHLDDCPMSDGVTIQIFSIAMGASIIILCRIFQVTAKYMKPYGSQFFGTCFLICSCFGILIVVFYEMHCFFPKTPSFVPSDPNYCHPGFYIVTYTTNIAVPFIVVLSILVHVPKMSINLSEKCTS